MRLLVCVVVCVLLAGCSDDARSDALQSATGNESGNQLCMPVDKSGVASFAWESVHNTTRTPVDVTGVEVDDANVEVVDWFLVDEDWSEAGVVRGQFPDPGRAKLASTIGPGQKVLVAFSLRADGLASGRAQRPSVTFTSDEGSGELPLVWGVRLLPEDQTCRGG